MITTIIDDLKNKAPQSNYFLYINCMKSDRNYYDANYVNLVSKAQKLVQFTRMITILSQEDYIALCEKDELEVYLELNALGDLFVVFKNSKDSYFNSTNIKDIYTKINQRSNTANELLIQAIKEPKKTKILDCTAGLGKDAVIMANHGYTVTMIEKNPILATILYYAQLHNYIKSQNLNLIFADSLNLDLLLFPTPVVIYLDPMFKEKNTAKPKKEMQIIQKIIELESKSINDHNQDHNNYDYKLFQLALYKSQKKVVVKRDNKQKHLVATPNVSYSKQGKTVRYDVYIKSPIII